MLEQITLIRHGQSEGNVDEDTYLTIPDHRIKLTDIGMEQAKNAGTAFKSRFPFGSKEGKIAVYVSPYERAKETYRQFREGFGPDVFKDLFEPPKVDVRIREREWGDYQSYDREKVASIKKRYGAYFYRIPNGESGADCYDRVSDFLSTVFRHDFKASRLALFTHGDFIKAFVMRFFHMDYSWYEASRVIDNAESVVIRRVGSNQWVANYNGEILSTKGRTYDL